LRYLCGTSGTDTRKVSEHAKSEYHGFGSKEIRNARKQMRVKISLMASINHCSRYRWGNKIKAIDLIKQQPSINPASQNQSTP